MAIGNPINLTSNVESKNISVIATAGQTQFTVTGGYRINQISVFRNGVRLVDGRDFTALDGSIVTLLSAALVGDALEFQIFDDFRVADALSVNSGGTVNGNVTVTGILSTTNLSIGSSISLDATTGIITAVQVIGGTITGTATTAINAQGLIGTPDITVNNIVAAAGTFSGVLTYEDVTNIDSLGIVTARTGVDITANGLVVNAGVSTFAANLSIADKIIHTGDSNTAIRFPSPDTFAIETTGIQRFEVNSTGDVGLVGIATATGLVVVAGSGIYAGHTGVITATSFDGSFTGNITGAASQVTVADESSDTTCFPLFTTAATGNLPPKSGTNLTFNSSTGALTATSGAFSERTQVGTGALSDVALAVYNDTTTANEPTLYIQNDQSGGNLLQGFGGGSEKVKITAAGAATFAGEVYSGGNAFNGGANGSRLSPGGAIYASAGSGSLWTGYTTGSSSSTSTISAEGSASFKAPSGNGVVVQTAGGNEGSKFPFVGKNTSGTTTFSVNGDGTATFAGTVTAGTVSDSIGPLRRLGIQNKTANYTLVSGDAGKLIRITTGTITVPASVFTAGDMVSIFNVGSGDVTVSSSAVTVYNAADGDTGNTRTIAAKGMVTLVCTATNEFAISGSQLT